jgi:predicted lipoprotein
VAPVKAIAGRRARLLIGAALVVAAIAVLRPWSIRPLQTAQPWGFDAAEYVEEAWPRLLAEAERTATDVHAARSAAAPQRQGVSPPVRRAAFVRVTGVVTEIDRRSRVGVARLETTAGAPPVRVAIQVGPVLRGTALRDAAGFIHFTDFANQSDFAAVANGLNDRALGDVLAPLDVEAWEGRTVTVVGAAWLTGDAAAPVDLVPVQVVVWGGGR